MSRKHLVRPGECLVTIARQYGFNDYRTVFDHPDNAALKKTRPNPNILHPGDVVAIPDRKLKTAKIETGQMHRFTVVLPKKELHLRLHDAEGKPLANEPYVLEVDGEPPVEGKQTDGDGILKERVPVGRAGANLTIRERTLRLRFGQLNPTRDCPEDDLSGVQSRLRNLGYDAGSPGEPRGLLLRSALATFQADEGLEVTGEPDEPTRQKLEKIHGS